MADLTFRRTVIAGETLHHDFIASADGRDVGRIYRHHDGPRWQWFSWEPGGASGIAADRDAAIAALAAAV